MGFSSVGHASLSLDVWSHLVWRWDQLLLQLCSFIPAASLGATESSSSSPSPLESLPESVIWRKPVSLQPELPQPAFQIYAWHLGKQWCKPIWSPSTSSFICVWIWFGVLLMTEDLIKQSLHYNQLQLAPSINGKPQFPWYCPFVLFPHSFSSKSFSLNLIMLRSFHLIYFKGQSGTPSTAALCWRILCWRCCVPWDVALS